MLTQNYIHPDVGFVDDRLKKSNPKAYDKNAPRSSSESMISKEMVSSKDLEAIKLSEPFTECINNDNYYGGSDLTSDNGSSIMDIFEPRDLANLGLESASTEETIGNHAVFKHKDTHKSITAYDDLSHDDLLFKPELDYMSNDCKKLYEADSSSEYDEIYESKIMIYDLLNNEDLKELASFNKNKKGLKSNESADKSGNLIYTKDKGSIGIPITTVTGYNTTSYDNNTTSTPLMNNKKDANIEIALRSICKDEIKVISQEKYSSNQVTNESNLKKGVNVSSAESKEKFNGDNLPLITGINYIDVKADQKANKSKGYKKIIKGTLERGLGKILKKEHLIESGTLAKIEGKAVLQAVNIE